MTTTPSRLASRRPLSGASKPEPTTTARRVLRRLSATNDHVLAIKTALRDLDGVDTQLALLATQRASLEAQIREQMETGKLESVSDGKYDVSVKDVKSRASRTIDAHKFFDLLASRGEKEEAAAWDALKVGVADAKKLLSVAELNRNFPETPGKVTGTAVVISRVSVKVDTRRG